MYSKQKLTSRVAAIGIASVTMGLIIYASVLGRTATAQVEAPPQFAAKVPEGAVATLFGSTYFDLVRKKATTFSVRPLTYYQCRAVVDFALTGVSEIVAQEDYPMTLSGWRASGALLWEYSAVRDVSAQIPSDPGARKAWASSLAPGSLYIGKRGSDNTIIYVGCVTGDTSAPFRILQKDAGALPRFIVEAIPTDRRQTIRDRREWTTKAGQVHHAYYAYLAEKKALPRNSADFTEVMGKEITRAWTDDLRKYVDDYYIPRANEAAREGGFVPASLDGDK